MDRILPSNDQLPCVNVSRKHASICKSLGWCQKHFATSVPPFRHYANFEAERQKRSTIVNAFEKFCSARGGILGQWSRSRRHRAHRPEGDLRTSHAQALHTPVIIGARYYIYFINYNTMPHPEALIHNLPNSSATLGVC